MLRAGNPRGAVERVFVRLTQPGGGLRRRLPGTGLKTSRAFETLVSTAVARAKRWNWAFVNATNRIRTKDPHTGVSYVACSSTTGGGRL